MEKSLPIADPLQASPNPTPDQPLMFHCARLSACSNLLLHSGKQNIRLINPSTHLIWLFLKRRAVET